MEGGGMLLPGQRFCPMEDELLMFYLKPKVNGMEVPGNEDVICEMDLYGDQDPWKIWERFEARRANNLRRKKDLYFFTQKKKKTARSSRASRTVGSGGTWKGQNAAKEIYLLDQKQQPTSTLLGFKKTYTYKNKGSVHHGCWIMYEFELDKSQLLHKKQVNKNEYVLCLLRKNDVLPEKKRKRQEEEEMLEDYVEDGSGDNIDPESVIEEPQEKRQRLLPCTDIPAPSLEAEQEAVPTPLDVEPLFLQFEADQGATPLELAELEKWFVAEFYAENVASLVDENSGLQQLESEPQLGEENLEQQLDTPLFAADGMMSDLHSHPEENPVQQMGAEANVDGGNLSDAMLGENWPMSFLEDLMIDEQPNTMEVGEWNAAYSDFEYFAF
ncbi:NAC domain-containing protein 6-like [Rosa chinensis]|uniref:NAC domain-containing protein 6-like n=1 Tax=Rosa chinensis TaxID=74649 RepID=UPI001AD8A228|nr:NAC domain-containing protein 6-like [Rosa chinensis]